MYVCLYGSTLKKKKKRFIISEKINQLLLIRENCIILGSYEFVNYSPHINLAM